LYNASAIKANAQEIPDLQDGVICCTPGALPYYIACNDDSCTNRIVYPNGNLKAEGTCMDGKKDKFWTAFYDNGMVMSKGEFLKGFPTGNWVFYFENGKQKAIGEFVPGKFELDDAGSGNFSEIAIRSGHWTFYYDNGNTYMDCNFDANEYSEETFNGNCIIYYANGNKKSEGIYRNNMKTGLWTYWYENGVKEKEESYLYQDCGLHDYVWFECPDGKWQYWDKDSKLMKTETYVDGKLKKTKTE
jgi:antitoxin component YwqK of YwqJK toxin-antitoxin module